jgi:tRNA(fMet)-specific endonuclease VapC
MPLRYLLDTDTCVFYLKNTEPVVSAVNKVRQEELAISQITLAELQFGAFNSTQIEKNLQRVDYLERSLSVIPLDSAITREFAQQKARLRKEGMKLDDFDLLIGATALINRLTLVTNNVRHFERLDGLTLENWAQNSN